MKLAAFRMLGAVGLLLALPVAGSGGTEVPPLRDDAQAALLEIALPPFETLDPVVANQLRDGQRALDAATSRPGAGGRELASAYGALARVCHAYELFDAAEPLYREASRRSPDDATWPHLLGFLYQQTGRLAEAAEQFEEALRLEPKDHAAAVRLGQVLLGLDRRREARERFDALIEIYPALAQQGLGEIALREGRFSRALDHFRAALARVRQATSLHYPIAMALRGLGRVDEARVHLAQRGAGAITVGDPIVDALPLLVRGERGLIARGRLAYDAGRYQEAADAFLAAIAAAPESVPARANLALSLSNLGLSDAAREHFEAALRLDPGHSIAHAGLGMLLVRQGRDADAIRHLRVAHDAMPDDHDVQRELVAALLRTGRPGDAITLLTSLAAGNPDDEDVSVSLSLLLAGQSAYRDAVAVLDAAHRRNPERPTTMTTLARLLSSAPDRAVRDGARALDLATAVWALDNDPVHAETVALALAELERCGDALQWMRRAVGLAEKTSDAAERDRLRAQLPRFEDATCRAPY